jgi:alginate O-acetyltransferase complex protein AlgI
VGISFYVFHGVSLLADSVTERYRVPGVTLAQHFERTFLYLIFFPQLIAGPISKAGFFMPQIGRKRFGEIDWHFAGEQLIFGYFSKFVIANNLAGC